MYLCKLNLHFRMLFFLIIGPTLQIAVFCLTYARDLEDLKIYYTNGDIRKWCLLSIVIVCMAEAQATVVRDHMICWCILLCVVRQDNDTVLIQIQVTMMYWVYYSQWIGLALPLERAAFYYCGVVVWNNLLIWCSGCYACVCVHSQFLCLLAHNVTNRNGTKSQPFNFGTTFINSIDDDTIDLVWILIVGL